MIISLASFNLLTFNRCRLNQTPYYGLKPSLAHAGRTVKTPCVLRRKPSVAVQCIAVNFMSSSNFASVGRFGALLAAVVCTGCQPPFQRIDQRVESMVHESSQSLGPDAYPPTRTSPQSSNDRVTRRSAAASENPPTVNPAASELPYRAIEDATNVLARLNAYNVTPNDALKVDLPYALSVAAKSSREHQFAQEEYVLAALRLLIERHLWGPRFFNDTSATVIGRGNDGMYDTSLRLVNEFGVTQRLPYGGSISARALATAAEDLHQRVAAENVQDATLILQADIPLLRGAGISARESRIQAERDLIYAARDYEQFRRDFFFDIAQDFLNLIVLQRSVANAENELKGIELVAKREAALYESGRSPLFQKGLAEQSAVSALDTLNSRRESLRLAIDRFKVRLGISLDQAVVIVPSGYDLAPPQVDLESAVTQAMAFRLDLQTGRDQVDDALRFVEVANNNVLPDLNLTGSASMPTDPSKNRGGLGFSPGDSTLSAGVTFSMPLDRDIERMGVRQAQIRLERQRRSFDQLRDSATINVRSAVRDIDRARFTLEIQERSVLVGQQRVDSIEAAPDRATTRDATDASNALARARDRRDSAARDLQVAILRYLLETGQLRVDPDGHLQPLRDMPLKFTGGNPAPAAP